MRFVKLGQLPKFEAGSFFIGQSDHDDYIKEPEIPEYTGSQCPAPIVLENRIRCFFSARDLECRSNCFYYDLDSADPLKVIAKSEKPFIPLGPVGSADEDGVMISQARGSGNLWYSGWNEVYRRDIKYRTACMGFDPENGRKWVIHDRSEFSPCGTGMPFEKQQELKGEPGTYYMSFKKWVDGEPIYGISWFHEFCGEVEDTHNPNYCYARPVVITIDGIEHLFYSKRSVAGHRKDPINDSYKIYYKKEHYKEDSAEVLVEIEGESNPMVCYGYPIKVDNRILMFYNNGTMRSPVSICEIIV